MERFIVSLGIVALAGSAGLAGAGVMGFTGITLETAPTVDLTTAEIDALNGDFGVISPPVSAAPDITASTARMLSFSTAAGTVGRLRGPSAVVGLSTDPVGSPDGDLVRNVWGFQGPEIDGAASLLGVNVGAGVDNAGANGDSFDVIFADRVVGAAGEANDFFIMDIIGDDAVRLDALDAAGNAIDGFSLVVQSGPGANNFGNSDLGDFGLAGFDLALVLDNSEVPPIASPTGTVIDDVPLAGAAFDIEDFGDGTLDALYGFRVTGIDPDISVSSGEGSIDLIAIGYSADAVPTPGALVPLALGGVLAGRRRR